MRRSTTTRRAAWLCALCLLAGCAAPQAQPDAGGPSTAPTGPAAPPAPEAAVATTPAAATPSPAPPVSGPSAVSRACRVDADCAVKDVGSCCGAFPACVAKDARTDPAAVQAQCAASGMASTCGFREVSGCTCVSGTCQDAGGSGLQVR